MNNKSFKNFANQDFRSFSDGLFSLSAFEFTLVGSIIGFAVSEGLNTNQQNSLGNFFTLIGQVLMTENAQNITLAQGKRKSKLNPNFSSPNTKEDIYNIKNEINKIIDEIYGNN